MSASAMARLGHSGALLRDPACDVRALEDRLWQVSLRLCSHVSGLRAGAGCS